MMKLEPVEVIIRGKHNVGKTTLAHIIKMCLEENEYRDVKVSDVPALPAEQKETFSERFNRNRELRPVHIKVEVIS